MHRLDRAAAAVPACLSAYHVPENTWDDVSTADKRQIRLCLEQMQGPRCAYCEGSVYGDGHIEHFRRKHNYPQLTFEWANLFQACGSSEHCGHYKDRPSTPAYDPANIIKPDEEEPGEYLYYHSSGEVRPRSHQGAPNPSRAIETIRVFNLNAGSLQAERRRALKAYTTRNPCILEDLMDFDDESRQVFIAQEIEATRQDPFCTVIRHYFEKAH